MRRYRMMLAAAALIFASCQFAAAQSYIPSPPIAKPIVVPKPVANRLIKRPDDRQKKQVPAAGE